MLSRYTCTNCGAHPSKEKEIFFGCSKCGNKLFKMLDKTNIKNTLSLGQEDDKEDLNLTTISMKENGVFKIDVEKLIDEKDSPVVAVADKNGVIHLKL